MTDPHVKAMLPAEAEALAVSLGERRYRGRQILEWIHARNAGAYAEMSSLPKRFRARLEQRFPFDVLEEERRVRAADGTEKRLLRTPEGFAVEAVLMPRGKFLSACVSSQAGCPLACRFCATGRTGFKRDLLPEEIVEQVLLLRRASPAPLTHVVFMGMGEPLLNLDAVLRALRVLTHPGAGGFPPSRITVSTAGVVEGLERLAREETGVNVALSLNAPDDATRKRLMPGAAKTPLADILRAFETIPASRRHPKTLEYLLLAGENDAPWQARKVASIARRTKAKVNLIPCNEVKGMPFRAPPERQVEAFLKILSDARVTATVRRSQGAEIAAACGQLAGRSSR